MFESEPSDAQLIDLIGEEFREECAAMGRRLDLIAEVFIRRREQLLEAGFVHTNPYEATAAEISPILKLSHHRAMSQVHTAATVRERLPRVGKLARSGLIDHRVLAMIITRTENVEDDVIARVDAAIARQAHRWMRLSVPKLRDRIDVIVAEVDPAAVRVPRPVEEGRYVEVKPGDCAGMAYLNGYLRAEDGAAIDAGLDALAATVCPDDPRSLAQRRADACGALARREASLACLCGREDCPAGERRAEAAAAVIHVLADQATITGTSDKPGYLAGLGVLPAESVRAVAAAGATLTPLPVPGAGCAADAGYRPSATTKQFVCWRDLTCRWPGCDKPAWRSDIDHTTPWPYGPTHPSNIKCYCRTHHLIKTFHAGWTEQHLPDGTLLLTSPTGHTYRGQAHGADLFATLRQSTGDLGLPPHTLDPRADRTALMPTRRATREQQRRDRITTERRQRLELNAERQRQHQAWQAATYEPPPF